MAHSDIRDETSPRPRGTPPRPGDAETPPENKGPEKAGEAGKQSDRRPRRVRGSGVPAAERDRMLKDVRNIHFPVGLRGYDRAAVDRYVEQVNRLIAELEISSSPEAAVRHALDEISEETRDLLQRAQATADEITTRSRMRADERLEAAEVEAQQAHDAARREADEVRGGVNREVQELRQATERETAEQRETASREVAELRETAGREVAQLRETATREAGQLRESATRETQELRSAAQRAAEESLAAARREADDTLSTAEAAARELSRNAEAIWRERRRLIDDMRSVGEQMVGIAETENKRFAHFAENGEASGRPQAENSMREPRVETPPDRAPLSDRTPSAAPTAPGDRTAS